MTEIDLLKYIALGAGFLYLLFYGTWIFYTSLMHIKKHRETLKAKAGVIWHGLYPVAVVALLMDVLFNFTWGTLYFRELPKELLFTTRCQRHMKGKGIQLMRAERVCIYLLNPFDEGHCD